MSQDLTAEDLQRASAEEQELLNENATVLKAQNDYLLQRIVMLRAAYNQLQVEVENLRNEAMVATDVGDGVDLDKDPDEEDTPLPQVEDTRDDKPDD